MSPLPASNDNICLGNIEEYFLPISVYRAIAVESLDVVIGPWFTQTNLCDERCTLQHLVQGQQLLFVNLSLIGISIEVLVALLVEAHTH